MLGKSDAFKERLLKQLERRLDEMLDEITEDQLLHITEIEEMTLKARAEMGRLMTQALVEIQDEVPVPGPQCPTCQQEMHYKGRKKKGLETRSGSVEIERAYYYCPPCKQGHFPPG